MNRVLIVCVLAMFFGLSLKAQERYFDERYVYTHHYVNPALVNPAYSGVTEERYIFFNYRNKWASFPGTPKTVTFGYSGTLGNRLSIGTLLMNDSNAGLRTTKGQLALAYSIESPTNKMAFAISTEYIQHKVSGDVLNNGLVNLMDELLLSRLDGNNFFDVSFGVYGIYEGKVSYGLAFPSLISSKLSDDSNTGSSSDREIGYILNLGYKHMMEEHDIAIEPSITYRKLMLVPSILDLNLKLEFLERKFTGGINYGIGADERFGFLLGTRVNNLNFYYSYNVSRHEFQMYNNGSHEISVAIHLGGKEKEMKAMDNDMMGQ